MLELNFGFTFSELYSQDGLKRLDASFLKYLYDLDLDLYQRLALARAEHLEPKEESKLITDLAWYLEDFLATLFNIENEIAFTSDLICEMAVVFKIKRFFIQRQVAREFANQQTYDDIANVIAKLTELGANLTSELDFSRKINQWEIEKDEVALGWAKYYAAWALFTNEGKQKHKDGVLFKIPKKFTSNDNLLDLAKNKEGAIVAHHTHNRHGFSLTDKGLALDKALDSANYCIHCHNQGKDSCSHGLKAADGSYKVNDLQITLTGCPLEEKISEMNMLKSEGSVLGALAVVMIDNPMCAGTGHRICNDCMKACIYQKQEPVNIPLVETKSLDDVLKLPYGFEVYSLLTRWNPLKFVNYLPKDTNNKKILVCGLGPAGYTLAHYLLHEGFTVVAIDGLKIEPLEVRLSGITIDGVRAAFAPIKDIEKELYEDLNKRKAYGFGGVAEYGITVRWNKNYLKILRLLLERIATFRMFGGVRFGSNITYQNAKDLGFDHIALAMGAGKPNLLDIPNTMARGVRTASDFLMALQLTGAAREDSLANLELRLPVCIVGGGLTAIDAATEALAYYPVMVEKFLKKFEEVGDEFYKRLTEEERLIAQEYIDHAKKLREHPADTLKLLKSWGGARVLYRKSLANSPAYRLNHEEVEMALEEGIEFIENITPTEVRLDSFGHVQGINTNKGIIDTRSILLAIGTQPNTVIAEEEDGLFTLNGRYFQACDLAGNPVPNEPISKPKSPNVIIKNHSDGLSISFFGDLHPSYTGNVVRAMASAKQGYPEVVQMLSDITISSHLESAKFFELLDRQLLATIQEVNILAPKIIEIVIHSPSAAKNFRPGQFFRVQNFETACGESNSFKKAMEGLALTGASVDLEKGLISTIVLEMGGSSDFCKDLRVGEKIMLMGPTGEPTVIPKNKKVLLIGGGIGNAVLFSIGKAMLENGCQVLYFAGYKKQSDRYKEREIEAAANQVVWSCDEALLSKHRAQDLSHRGNLLETLIAYGKGDLPGANFSFKEIDQMIVIGSDRMMAALAYARHHQLKGMFKDDCIAIGSINSPMQCMMKELCGQCIQRHVNPLTKEESYVYSCKNQDQLLDEVDFNHLKERLAQNRVQEKLTACILAVAKK